MITFRNLSRTFLVGDQEVHALRNLDLTIGAGEYVSIMGPSGSGKSTLLHIIGLLDRPSGGTYVLDGKDTTTLGDDELAHTRRTKIGFVFQFFHLVPRMTAAENIALPLTLAGLPPPERDPLVKRALDRFNIADRADHRPDQLSGGQRQRVAIARATVMEPPILLADEPTGNLDRAAGKDVLNILEELHERGITVIVVTHDPEIGERAHRHIRLVDGAISVDDGQGTG